MITDLWKNLALLPMTWAQWLKNVYETLVERNMLEGAMMVVAGLIVLVVIAILITATKGRI